MESKIKQFMNNDTIPVELLAQLDIRLPTINLNLALGEEMSRTDVEKLMKLLPIQSAIIDISSTWENCVTHYMQPLALSKTIIDLTIKGCNKEVQFLPPNIEELSIEGRPKLQTIGYAAAAENLRKLKITNGTISSDLFSAIRRRHRPLEYLHLNGADIWINNPEDIGEAMENVTELMATDLKWMGSPMDEKMKRKLFRISAPPTEEWDRETIEFIP